MVSRDSRTTDEPKPIGLRNCKASVAIVWRNQEPAAATGQLETSAPGIITSSPSARAIGIAIGTAGATISGTGTVAAL